MISASLPLEMFRASLGVVLALALSACSPRPSDGEPELDPEQAAVTSALGVPMPPGTVLVREVSGAGPEGGSQHRAALATRSTQSDAAAFVRALPGAQPAARGCFVVSGTQVCVAPPEDVPRTLFAPVTPVADSAPSWALAWVVVTRTGAPTCPVCMDGQTPPPGCSCR